MEPRRRGGQKAELEALMVLPQVQAEELPHGKLAVHEEFPEAVAKKLSAFLNEHGAQAGSG
jgi:hypothetical protein